MKIVRRTDIHTVEIFFLEHLCEIVVRPGDVVLFFQRGTFDRVLVHESDEFDIRLSGPIVVQISSDPETALALLVVRLRSGGEPVVGAVVRLLDSADPGAPARVLTALPGVPGSYGTPEFAAPEFGEWTVTVGIEYPDGRRLDSR